MSERDLYPWLLAGWLVMAAIVFVVLQSIVVPYGRHARRGWGPSLDARLGWFAMELPALAVFVALFAVGDRPTGTLELGLLGLWTLHYGYRSLVYPWTIRGGRRSMPWVLALGAVTFNTVNAWFNARWLFHLAPVDAGRPLPWLSAVGALLFLGGFALHVAADRALTALRRDGDTGYRVPRGPLFRRVSCPNYLGEIVEWCGWALASQSLAGASFAVWTLANLLPRALAHHRWYRERFDDYPRERRALVPFLL